MDKNTALPLEQLGRALFFDANLSLTRSQSCASCHAPNTGFVDHRGENIRRAASLGDDQRSLGDRNAPSASYAAHIPDFHKNKEGLYIGGQFWDGRAKNLTEQAMGPPLNPSEMGLPDKQTAINRLKENPVYTNSFKTHFGEDIFKDPNKGYHAMATAIATFEKSEFFSPFDSKYDRHLQGEYTMTAQEELGMTLFFSQQFTNCNLCHQLHTLPNNRSETFSNYQFHNIGVPINHKLRALNGVAEHHIDDGLLAHPDIHDEQHRGKYKTPSLRNVAVTAPYMHNGVFKDLRTVVLFYNKYNSKSEKRQINPETQGRWNAPEVADTLSIEELETGPALDNKRIDALVAFLKTLTDKRYEPLLEQPTTP